MTFTQCECVYEIPCKNGTKSYVGETGRAFGIRFYKHRKEAEQMSCKRFKRATRKDSVDKLYKSSAITDHVAQYNHVIDWEREEIIDKDSNKSIVKM